MIKEKNEKDVTEGYCISDDKNDLIDDVFSFVADRSLKPSCDGDETSRGV